MTEKTGTDIIFGSIGEKTLIASFGHIPHTDIASADSLNFPREEILPSEKRDVTPAAPLQWQYIA